jgi:hypothetical protein
MNGKRNSGDTRGGGRSTSLPDWNVVANAQRKWNNFLSLTFENLSVSAEDEMVLKFAADLVVAARR